MPLQGAGHAQSWLPNPTPQRLGHMIEWEQASPAPHLDVGAREVIFGHDQVVQGHVVGQRHPARVDLEDALLGLLVGQRELDLPVNAACGHTRLSVTALVPRGLAERGLASSHESSQSQCPVPNLKKKKSVSGLKMSGYTEYTIPLTLISRGHSLVSYSRPQGSICLCTYPPLTHPPQSAL